jgi:hypothetical protein
VNRPLVRPLTSFGTAVVIALIDEPDGPKLMVEAMLNMWMPVIQPDRPGSRGTSEKSAAR